MKLQIACKVLGIGIAAIVGVIIRLLVNRLFDENLADVTSSRDALFVDMPANVLGCMILGVHESWKRRFSYPDWLNISISTGLAGSVTTFASWHLQVVRMLVEGQRVEAFVSVFLGLCVAFCALALGRDIGDLAIYVINKKRSSSSENIALRSGAGALHEEVSTPDSALVCIFSVLLFLFVDIYAAVVVGAVVDNDEFSTRDRGFLWICGAFAPYGALLRWWLSRFNSVKEQFPLGTLAANMAAMILDLAILAALRMRVDSNVSQKTRFVLMALISGFGGSLSTVSTWVSESSRLSRPWRYLNLIGTSAAAIILGLIIYGVTYWAT